MQRLIFAIDVLRNLATVPHMKVTIILNRDRASLRAMAKKALSAGHDLVSGRFGVVPMLPPEYDSFGTLLDPDPIFVGMDEKLDIPRISNSDLLIWEWGWTSGPPRRLLEIRSQVELPTIAFPGAVDRFWRELDSRDFLLHCEAAQATNGVGVFLRDMIGFYQSLLPHAHVFHLPVPVDIDRVAQFAAGWQSSGPVLLASPLVMAGAASQMPISSLLAFRSLRKTNPGLHGLAYAYSVGESESASKFLSELQLNDAVAIRMFVRPLQRFLQMLSGCSLAILLTNSQVQGRLAMLCAALGIPVVASDNIETHRTLFPQTTVRWYETDKASLLSERLLRDPDFRNQVISGALAALGGYSVQTVSGQLKAAAEEIVAAFEARTA